MDSTQSFMRKWQQWNGYLFRSATNRLTIDNSWDLHILFYLQRSMNASWIMTNSISRPGTTLHWLFTRNHWKHWPSEHVSKVCTAMRIIFTSVYSRQPFSGSRIHVREEGAKVNRQRSGTVFNVKAKMKLHWHFIQVLCEPSNHERRNFTRRGCSSRVQDLDKFVKA